MVTPRRSTRGGRPTGSRRSGEVLVESSPSAPGPESPTRATAEATGEGFHAQISTGEVGLGQVNPEGGPNVAGVGGTEARREESAPGHVLDDEMALRHELHTRFEKRIAAHMLLAKCWLISIRPGKSCVSPCRSSTPTGIHLSRSDSIDYHRAHGVRQSNRLVLSPAPRSDGALKDERSFSIRVRPVDV
jgi:hypothetical protein